VFSHPWRWWQLTHRSFFGVYGTMDIFSPRGANDVQRLCAIALLVLAWWQRKRPPLPGRRLLTTVGLAMIAVTLAAAFWRAWTFDFQAQGRYIFAIIPIAALLLMDGSERRVGAMHWGIFVVLALAGFWSLMTALPMLA
jgi:hypothetical protein